MARRKKNKRVSRASNRGRKRGRPRLDEVGSGFDFGSGLELSPETKRGILIIILFVLAALSLLGIFNLSGGFGNWVNSALSLLLGSLKLVFPILCALFGYFLLREDRYKVRFVNYLGAVLLVIGLAALWHMRFGIEESLSTASSGLGGGYVGVVLSLPLLKAMSFGGTLVVSLAVFLVGLLLTFEMSIHGLMWPVKLARFLGVGMKKASDSWGDGRQSELSASDDYEEEEDEGDFDGSELMHDEEDGAPEFTKKSVDDASSNSLDNEEPQEPNIDPPKKFGKKIDLPLDILTSRSSKPTSGDIKNNQEIIKKTLANFNIEIEMGDVNVGPTVTQYTFRPADGVKLSKIINLNSDLSLALAAHPIRIEAPIPSKALVGIEIPNQTAARVTMMDLLTSKEFRSRENNLYLAMGKDVSGKSFFSKLDRMPHILIAGATGSGKSVCINSLIVSLLYQNSPDELKFILVDPKRVELPIYNDIPYLLTPVITDVKKTINALKWTIAEMERRFDILSRKHKRNIEVYNKSSSDKLPYIVFVIDELADLMSTSASDVEAGIVRLAQMARAVGIHLVLATQRPSVEVITGLIKANIPTRVAFSVASLIDSRTILDSSGAEKLVGRGDMLFLGPGVAKPKRLQGVFLSDKEIKGVVDHIKNQGSADYVDGLSDKHGGSLARGSASAGFSDDEGDALMGEAKEVIREAGKASASLLQRRLKIGYARAARILDLMEDQGIIGPADGAKPREVFIDQLGGVDDVVEFAAREHNLEGELVGSQDMETLQPDEGKDTEEEPVVEFTEGPEGSEGSDAFSRRKRGLTPSVEDDENSDETLDKTKKEEFEDDEWT